MVNLASEIKKIVKGEVLDDEITLEKYSADASIFKIVPQAVVYPKDAADVKALVKFAAAHKKQYPNLSLTARAGGSDMTGGSLNDSVILGFTRHFNRIKEIGKDYAVVEPGVFYRDFEKQAKARGLLLPSYPASKGLCALGGMMANNAGGEKNPAYGKTENYVMELKAVLEDGEEHVIKPLHLPELKKKMALKNFEGEIYRKIYKLIEKNRTIIQNAKPNVTKNSAGYYLWNVWDESVFDLTKLFVGSQGTLGIITEITFRLVRPKRYSRLAVVFLKNLDPLVEIIQTTLPYRPESFESYDDHTLKVALRFFPSFFRLMKAKNAISFALQFLPEFWMVIKGGLPKLILLIELTSDSEGELRERMGRLRMELLQFPVKLRVTKSEAETEKYWTMRRESFNLLRHHIKGRQTVPFIDDMVVHPDQLEDFLPRLNKILEPYGDKLIYTIAGHVADANFHIIPLMVLHDPETPKIIREISEKVYPLVKEFGGSITGEHNDGLIRTPYLELMYGKKIVKLFEEVKKIFDPHGIFNPRKKVGGDLEYALRHIK